MRQVVVVWNATAAQAQQDRDLQALAGALWRRHGPGSAAPLLHSLWANAQPARKTNSNRPSFSHLVFTMSNCEVPQVRVLACHAKGRGLTPIASAAMASKLCYPEM